MKTPSATTASILGADFGRIRVVRARSSQYEQPKWAVLGPENENKDRPVLSRHHDYRKAVKDAKRWDYLDFSAGRP